MNAKIIYLVLGILVAHYLTLFADQWMPAYEKEYFSSNGQHMLRVTPNNDRPKKAGHCMATLFKIDGEKKAEVWSRHLVNNNSPVRAFVADSGKYVVTMDEWAGIGRLPVVVYNYRGALINVHSTDSLGLKEDWKHIKRSTVSCHWNENSISFFGPEDETFFIQLHWGKLLLIQLRDGALMDDEWYSIRKGRIMPQEKWSVLHEYSKTQIPLHLTNSLDSKLLEGKGERVR